MIFRPDIELTSIMKTYQNGLPGEDESWRETADDFHSLLSEALDKQIPTDVILTIIGSHNKMENITCHSLILSANSGVLHTMLNEQPPSKVVDAEGQHSQQKLITLTGDDPDHFKMFLHMMYMDWNICTFVSCDEISGMTPGLAVSVLHLAFKYSAYHIVRRAQHLVRVYMEDYVLVKAAKMFTAVNALTPESLSQTGHPCLPVLRKLSSCILADGNNLFSSDAILQLNYKDVLDIVQHTHLQCPQSIVSKGCYRWAQEQCRMQNMTGNTENLKTFLGDIFEVVFQEADIKSTVPSQNSLSKNEMLALLFQRLNKTKKNLVERDNGFPLELRITEGQQPISRLDLNTSKNLMDFSTPHGFQMTVSKAVYLCALTLFGGESVTNNYTVSVEITVPKRKTKYTKVMKDVNVHMHGNRNYIVMDIFPEVMVPAKTLVIIQFTITGGRTCVSQEIPKEVTEEQTIWAKDIITYTFKASPDLANGLNQIPLLWLR